MIAQATGRLPKFAVRTEDDAIGVVRRLIPDAVVWFAKRLDNGEVTSVIFVQSTLQDTLLQDFQSAIGRLADTFGLAKLSFHTWETERVEVLAE